MAAAGESTLQHQSGPAIKGRVATVLALAVTLAVTVGLAYVSSPPSAASGDGVTAVNVPAGAGAGPVVGAPAPAFVATDADGASVDLSAYRGRPIWLTFGASWCQSCRAENPDIEAAWRRHSATGVVVVAVFLSEDATAVRDYAARVSLTYTRVPDPSSRLASAYRIVGLPSHFFIDAGGVLHRLRIGSLSPEAMDAELAQIGA